MKWFECIEDLGDGSTSTHRFKTRESARAWLESKELDLEDFGEYPLGYLEEVDTEGKYFWDDLKDSE